MAQIPSTPSPQPGGKKPGRRRRPFVTLTWFYVLAIISLGIMLYTNSGNNQAGGVDKEVDYTAFRTYVKQGYAREVVVNKTDGNVRFVVRPEHIDRKSVV